MSFAANDPLTGGPLSRVVFISHRGQLEHFGRCAPYLRAAGLKAELWTIDEADRLAGENTDLFDRVVDLLADHRRAFSGDIESATRSILELEAHYGPFLHRDAAIDRSIVGFSDAAMTWNCIRDRWSETELIALAAALVNAVGAELHGGSVVAAVGETNTLPYRILYRALRTRGVRHISPTYVAHSDGRLYFEDELTLQWAACVERYQHYVKGPVPEAERVWAYEKLQAIRNGESRLPFVDERTRGAESVLRRARRAQEHLGAWRHSQSEAGRESPRIMPAEVLSPRARARRLLAAGPRARFYERLARRDLPAQEFAAYFLHVQPETAVDCLAFPHQDQVALIRNIVSVLPAGVQLVVKDHKFDAGRRSQEYYGELAAIPSVWLVHDEVPTLEVVRRSRFVATLSGTVAFEAMCCGTPTGVFGDIYYSAFEGVTAVSSAGELGELIQSPLGLPSASTESAISALAARYSAAHPAELPWAGGAETFTKALLSELHVLTSDH